MIRREKQGLVYYQSQPLQEAGVRNFFFTRQGGFSEGSWAELNLSFRVGDNPRTVMKNYTKIKKVLEVAELVTVSQVHGKRIIELDGSCPHEDLLRNEEADGIITSQRGLAVGVLVADCFPLILFEPDQKILANLHCGRRPIAQGIIENALGMIKARGGEIKKVIVALGPGVCADCYTVDNEVIDEFQARFPKGRGKIWRKKGEKFALDLRAAITAILGQAGLKKSSIDDLGICTCCSDEFFSHRRSKGKAGRQLALAMLE